MVGTQFYWFAGPAVGFTSIVESAVGYVSPEIAKLAADEVYKRYSKLHPHMLPLKVIRVQYATLPYVKILAATVVE